MRRSLVTSPHHPPEAAGRAVVVAADAAADALARGCARRLGAALMTREAWEAAEPTPVAVWCSDVGVGLRGPPRTAAVRHPPRPSAQRQGRDPLVRALGGPAARLSVVDATAGWGIDAGVLAAAGATVTMIERAPAMALVLESALARWSADAVEAAARLTLHEGDARALLPTLRWHDVVYLDPLFPGRATRATSAASLRWLRTVAAWPLADADDAALGAGPTHGDTDAERSLLDAARACAVRRVVVKRARNDPHLAGVAPSGSLTGRTTRYDLYPGGAATTT